MENAANLMTINFIGLPLNLWDLSLKHGLGKNPSAVDNRVRQKKAENYDDNQVAIWKFLK